MRWTASGIGPSRSPAPPPSTPAGTRSSLRCHAVRRATAPPGGFTWQAPPAIRVPGIVSAPAGGHVGPTAQVTSVSCASAGNCSVGGSYYDSVNIQAFVGSQVNGVWRQAVKVPGTAALNKGDVAQISSVSCASAGNCSAGGWYMDTGSLSAPVVVSEVNGTWQPAIRVPGIEALDQHVFGSVESVSCS